MRSGTWPPLLVGLVAERIEADPDKLGARDLRELLPIKLAGRELREALEAGPLAVDDEARALSLGEVKGDKGEEAVDLLEADGM